MSVLQLLDLDLEPYQDPDQNQDLDPDPDLDQAPEPCQDQDLEPYQDQGQDLEPDRDQGQDLDQHSTSEKLFVRRIICRYSNYQTQTKA